MNAPDDCRADLNTSKEQLRKGVFHSLVQQADTFVYICTAKNR